LAGERSPYRDIVLLNSGAALLIAGKAADLKAGAALAAQAIDSGKAKATLAGLVTITNRPLPAGGAA
jgi:anthranilate phosphoribosyltransferase